MNTDRFRFRCWDNINKRYDKDLSLIDKDGDLCYQDGAKYCNGQHPEDFTIEQCTGLKDRNGRLIYEGDVLNCIDTKLIVCFNPGIAAFVFVRDFDIELCRSLDIAIKMRNAMPAINAEYINRYEIIGNIHDDQFRDATKLMEETEK
jgi:uncharacterized phage protein (TIGR01671 family)